MTFCMFGKDEVLKFCFYIFDKDKNGFIEEDELQDLVAILHQDGTNANVKRTLANLDTDKDGRIAFSELRALNEKYPTILYPAFKIQHSLKTVTMGHKFFSDLQRQCYEKRVAGEREAAEIERENLERRNRFRRAAVKREMGWFRYYFCPNQRQIVLAKILPDIEPPVREKKKKKKRAITNMASKKKKKKVVSKRIAHRDDTRGGRATDYEGASKKRRARRRKKRADLGRTRIGKKHKVSTRNARKGSSSSATNISGPRSYASSKKRRNKKRRKRKKPSVDMRK